MTTVTTRPTAILHRTRTRLVTAIGVVLLVAGLTIGLLFAFSGRGTARPAGPAPAGPATTIAQHPSTVDPCHAKLRGPAEHAEPDSSRTRRREAVVIRTQKHRPTRRRELAPLDLRTPSGRSLPF